MCDDRVWKKKVDWGEVSQSVTKGKVVVWYGLVQVVNTN